MSEWFRNKAWSEATEATFFSTLQQSAPAACITALKVQGDLWLHGHDAATQHAGVRLLAQLCADYPQEIFEVSTVQEILGDYYYSRGEFEAAEVYLIPVVKFYAEYKRIGVVRRADLLLAETILLRSLTARLEEAYQLILNFPATGGSLSEDYEGLAYYELLAHVCYQCGRTEEAAGYARQAIALADGIDSDLAFMMGKPAAVEQCYNSLPDLGEIAGV